MCSKAGVVSYFISSYYRACDGRTSAGSLHTLILVVLEMLLVCTKIALEHYIAIKQCYEDQ